MHKLVVCGELALRFLPDSNRCGIQEAELVSCAESIIHCEKQTELFAHQYHIHERSRVPFFPCEDTCLKRVRTLEHRMFAYTDASLSHSTLP